MKPEVIHSQEQCQYSKRIYHLFQQVVCFFSRAKRVPTTQTLSEILGDPFCVQTLVHTTTNSVNTSHIYYLKKNTSKLNVNMALKTCLALNLANQQFMERSSAETIFHCRYPAGREKEVGLVWGLEPRGQGGIVKIAKHISDLNMASQCNSFAHSNEKTGYKPTVASLASCNHDSMLL